MVDFEEISDGKHKTHQEIADIIAALTPEWNNLEVELQDPALDAKLEDLRLPYAEVTENYELSALLTADTPIVGNSQAQLFNGAFTVGERWRPLNITIRADGHSYLHPGQKERWPEMLSFLQAKIDTLVGLGYQIQHFKALHNQKDNFPGRIDADDSIYLILANRQE